MQKLLLFGAAILTSLSSFAQIPNLDPGFGTKGEAHVNFGSNLDFYSETAQDLLQLSDGSYLVAGQISRNPLLLKFKANGQLDSGFANKGVLRITSKSGIVMSYVKKDASNNIYLMSLDQSWGAPTIFKIKPNGVIDSTYGTYGSCTPYYAFRATNDFYLDNQGQILLFGDVNFWPCVYKITNTGNVDYSFGPQGRVELAHQGGVRAMYRTSTGDFLIAAGVIVQNTTRYDSLCVMKISPQGQIDNTYGNKGKLKYNFTEGVNTSLGFLDANDNLIYLTKTTQTKDSVNVIRFTKSGILDASFGKKGVKTTLLFPNTTLGLRSLKYDSNTGKILVGGTFRENSTVTHSLIFRLNADFTIDNTFGTSGKRYLPFLQTNSFNIEAIAVDKSNNVLAIGYETTRIVSNVSSYNLLLTRLQTNGKIDSTFSEDGKISYFLPATSRDQAVVMLAGKTEHLYLIGTTFDGIRTRIGLSKVTKKGIIDPTYGKNGVQTFANDPTTNGDAVKHAVIDQNDYQYILAYYMSGVSTNTVVMKVKPNGTLDSTFGTNGKTAINNSLFEKVAVDNNGNTFLLQVATNMLKVWKYTPKGIMDGAYGTGGVLSLNVTDMTALNNVQFHMDPLGRLVIQGYYVNGSRSVIARINTNGQWDASFGTGGLINQLSNKTSDFFYQMKDKMAFNSKGEIYLIAGIGTNVRKLKVDGSVDSTFGTNGSAYVETSETTVNEGYMLGVTKQDVVYVGNLVYDMGSSSNLTSRIVFRRLLASGLQDADFGGDKSIVFPVRQAINFVMPTDTSFFVSSYATEDLSAYKLDMKSTKVLAIEETDAFETETVAYPNPFTDEIHVQLPNESTKLELYSLQGNLLMETKGNYLNTENVVQGLYLLKIKQGNASTMRKMTKD